MTLHKSRVFFFYFSFSRKKRIFHSRRSFGCAPFHLQMKMRSSRDHYRGKSQLWKWRAGQKLKPLVGNSITIQTKKTFITKIQNNRTIPTIEMQNCINLKSCEQDAKFMSENCLENCTQCSIQLSDKNGWNGVSLLY